MGTAAMPSGDRSILARSPLARLPDRALKYGLTALAGLILALIVFFFVRLVGEAQPAFAHDGVFGFVFGNDWNVSGEKFGALLMETSAFRQIVRNALKVHKPARCLMAAVITRGARGHSDSRASATVGPPPCRNSALIASYATAVAMSR